VICVSTIVRPPIVSVSRNPSAEALFITVPGDHHCEPLHIAVKSHDFAVLHPEDIAAGNIDFPACGQNRPIGCHEAALVRAPNGKLDHHPIVHSINAEDLPVDVRECLSHAAGD